MRRRRRFAGSYKGDAKLCLPTRNLAPNDQRHLMISEVYHKLRMDILLARSDEPPKTLLFTSSTAGEGKTITATNTAITFARMGSRVLLLDADLRHPSCLRALRMTEGDVGLSDYLANLVGLDQVIRVDTDRQSLGGRGGLVAAQPDGIC